MKAVLKEIRHNSLPDLRHDPLPAAASGAVKGQSNEGQLTTKTKPLMFKKPVKASKRVLEPYDRVSEVLFGLIMVLTFTGSLSIAEAGRENIHTMLIGALGCNLAWGIIDGVFYLMGCLAEKGRGLLALHAVRKTIDP